MMGVYKTDVVCAEKVEAVTDGDRRELGAALKPMSAARIVTILMILENWEHRRPRSVSVSDGFTDHAVMLWGTTPALDYFHFFDPDASFLTKGKNEAGVAAERVDDKTFRITSGELEKVVLSTCMTAFEWHFVTSLFESLVRDEKGFLRKLKTLRIKNPRNQLVDEGSLDLFARALSGDPGLPDLAIALFRVNAGLHPSSAKAAFMLADGYLHLGQFDAAATAFETSLKLVNEDSHISERDRVPFTMRVAVGLAQARHAARSGVASP